MLPNPMNPTRIVTSHAIFRPSYQEGAGSGSAKYCRFRPFSVGAALFFAVDRDHGRAED
jgi:hypothetical protein